MIKFAQQGVGLAKAISIGNKALSTSIAPAYLTDDSATKVIAYYIDGFGMGEGREFVLRRIIVEPKPVILMKNPGKQPPETGAVSSHTASPAISSVFTAAVAQHNIIEAANESELVSFVKS